MSFILLFYFNLVSSKLKYSGMTVTNGKYCPNITFDSPVSVTSFQHIRSIGTNYVALIDTQYQEYHNSTKIFPIYGTPQTCNGGMWACKTAEVNQLIYAINLSHSLNMSVLLKPHIDLTNDPNYWRGEIGKGFNKQQWDDWFQNYEQFILFYANIAQQNNVEMFSVSCELIVVSAQTSYWEKLIPKIRNVYKGILTSAANWNPPGCDTEDCELEYKKWWNLMDVIGCDAYYNNINNASLYNGSYYPTVSQLLVQWEPIENQLLSLHKKWNKPVIFTEIGYCSGVNNSCDANWDMNKLPPPTNDSLNGMANHYDAALTAMSQYDWFEGIFWWNWATDAAFGGLNDSCMTPSYKPAETLLRKWYEADQDPPPPPNYKAECQCWL